MDKIFNKLVRDKIPDKIRNNGEMPITRVLSEDEYKSELFKKLDEEKSEVICADSKEDLIEELADMYEVLNAILDVNKISFEEVELVRKNKYNIRGGFEKRIYLEKTISKE